MGMWTLPNSRSGMPDVTPARQAFLRATAERIVARGWEVPVVTLLEWGKPLASLWGAGLTVGSPFLGGLFDPDAVDHLGQVLGDAAQTELLLQTIEELKRA